MFPQIFGKYVLERELAAGGMARVFLATLRGAGGFEKRLVVKQIRPELASDQCFIGRFVAEAKTTVGLSHSNIVPVYELGAERGTYYIAMEYCEGASLDQLLRGGPLSPSEGAYVGVEICRALDYAHRKAGIIHRDVTPRNVMIDAEGMVRLIDFGIAASPEAPASGHEPLFGSPGHIPPEQLRSGPLTPAADVFAVAALLIETWTGKPPFRRASFEASVEAMKAPPPDIAESVVELSPLSELVRAALSLDPEQRPQSAEELARPLREFLRASDLGDIARRLGRRVMAHAEQTEEASAPRTLVEVPAPAAGATQTFAARDVLLEWTAPIDSQPPRLSRTAPLPETTPPPRAVFRRRLGALSAAAMAVLAATALLERGHGEESTAPPSASTPERPARAPEQAAAPRSEQRAAPAPPAATSLEVPAPAEPPAVALTSLAKTGPARPLSAATQAGARASQAGGQSAAPAPSAHVDLTSEPRAQVRVDGKLLGQTPLSNVAIGAGFHEVVFTSELLGEQLSTRLSLGAKDRRRVHADFSSASPQLYVR